MRKGREYSMPAVAIDELEQIVDRLTKPELQPEDLTPTQKINTVIWTLSETLGDGRDPLSHHRLLALKAKAKRRLRELNSNPYRSERQNSAIIRLLKISRELEAKLKIYA